MNVKPMEREFRFNGVSLPDPDPKMAVDEVRGLYTPTYPELANATVEGPDAIGAGDRVRYTFRTAVGTKG